MSPIRMYHESLHMTTLEKIRFGEYSTERESCTHARKAKLVLAPTTAMLPSVCESLSTMLRVQFKCAHTAVTLKVPGGR